MWLNAARYLDRFAITIGQIDVRLQGHRFPPAVQRPAACVTAEHVQVNAVFTVAFMGESSLRLWLSHLGVAEVSRAIAQLAIIGHWCIGVDAQA
ncbi:hypothetical protein PpSQ1_07050 [Pseudomonas putida]|nr:hypothetical protein PpSQ1_07050 [Pseudomonas putida]